VKENDSGVSFAMPKTPPYSNGRVSPVRWIDRETTKRALQLAVVFVLVILVAAFIPF